jgi:DNA-binding transcriptional ArsR family regulator
MVDLRVIDDPQCAAAALDPVRNRLLSELREPEGVSAATLAGRVGLARQKVNYHLRTLEKHGLVREAGRRLWGGLTERRMVATAAAYVVSPGALGAVAADPDGGRAGPGGRGMDRLCAAFLVALAARVVREVGGLMRRSEEMGKPLATLSIDTRVRFRSAAERAAFSGELTAAVAALVAKYHDGSSPGGRLHRVMVGAYPSPVGEGETGHGAGAGALAGANVAPPTADASAAGTEQTNGATTRRGRA